MAVFNSVQLSEAVRNNRFSAEFFDPRYVFTPARGRVWFPIGRLLNRCEYGLSVAMNNSGKGFPIFRMNEIADCFAEKPSKYADIPKSVFDAMALNDGDVLFNRTNSFEFVGRTGIVKGRSDCTFASYLIRLVPDRNRLLPEFLTIYLNTRFGIGQVKRRAMRSINQANVSGSEIRKVQIPHIDLSDQQGAADVLNEAHSLKDGSEELYAKAQQLLDSELGLDKLNFQKPIGWTACASDLANSRRSDAEFYDPVAREVVKRITALQHSKLRESFSVGSGFPWKGSKFRADNSGEPVVRIRNIKPSYIDTAELTSIDPGYANSIGFPKAQRGDVVVGMDGIKYFYASLLEGECYVNQRVSHLSPKNGAKVSPEFAVFILNSRVGQAQLMRDMTVATTVGHITNRDVAKLVIPTISQDFHDKITALVRKSIDAKEESKRLLANAKARVDQLIEEAIQS